jgi:flagellar biosynthesis/type III secretory pathway chaperone
MTVAGTMTDVLASGVVAAEPGSDPLLTSDVIEHLEVQLQSARRMLAVVDEQGAAIRERNVPEVVRLAAALQAEMHRRELLEAERLRILERATVPLRMAVEDITINMLTVLMDPESARLAAARTQELRSILLRVQREHGTNRALMQQELAFLDHLLRLAGSAGGYGKGGNQAVRRRAPLLHRPVFDLEA